ncbi:ATP-dependent nuclease [Nonomuraea bangladeshensis]|uniref:ATP-dependent nuclease n=1 Tax=Nonomuraea bangladeshensis TaxID=404385 RepID=UPI003C2B32C9
MIEALFGYSTPAYASPDLGRVSGTFRVKLACPDGLIERTIDLQASEADRAEQWNLENGCPIVAYYTAPTNAFSEINFLTDNFAILDEQYERGATKAELDAIRNILGRSYERLTYRTHTKEYQGHSEWYAVYVTGLESGREVDSFMMSQGESWVHHVLGYFLSHQLGDEDLALLDEPETFLAQSAQRPLIDQVAREILKKNSQLIIDTHSFEVLNRFPLESIRVCVRVDGKIHVIRPSGYSIIKDAIGIESPVRALVLVEDRFAMDLLRSLFSIYDVALNRDTEIVNCGGESHVRQGIRSLSAARRVPCIAVLDGDQNDGTGASGDHLEAIYYLPGKFAPERELLDSVLKNGVFFSHLSGRTMSDILGAVDACAQLDHQYQIEKFASYLDIARESAIDQLVRSWLQTPEIESQARALIQQIRQRIET